MNVPLASKSIEDILCSRGFERVFHSGKALEFFTKKIFFIRNIKIGFGFEASYHYITKVNNGIKTFHALTHEVNLFCNKLRCFQADKHFPSFYNIDTAARWLKKEDFQTRLTNIISKKRLLHTHARVVAFQISFF